MEKQKKKNGYIIGLTLFGLLCIGAICIIIFVENRIGQIIGTITATISTSIEVSLAFDLRFNININKIKNEYEIILQDYRNEQNNYLSICKRFTQNIGSINIQQSSPIKETHDQILFKEIERVFAPIEQYRQQYGGFSARYKTDMFYDFCVFCDSCTMSSYYFGDQELSNILERLKVEACPLSKLMSIYNYEAVGFPGYSELKPVIIRRNNQKQTVKYSAAEMKENDEVFNKACEYLNNVVDIYKELVIVYRQKENVKN